jgi:pyridoxamine 5'-phosphate oxidase
MSLEGNRREYVSGTLRRSELAADPLQQFRSWLDTAIRLELKDATAMALATATLDAVPSVRIVLLKACDEQGFSFFTDYRSRKGRELTDNPVASAVFHWRELDRQVRLTGSVSKVSRNVSLDYFRSRPQASQLAAAISRQSSQVSDRATLERALAKLAAERAEGEVPIPEQWGGYLLRPEHYEFWQGREGRLHDRFSYSRSSDGWRIERLQP